MFPQRSLITRRLRQRAVLATNPHPLVEAEASQLNARILAYLTLIILPLHILTALALFAAYGPLIRSGRLVLASLLVTLFIYLLSRTRFVETAVNLFITELLVLAIALLYINADAYSAVTALLPIYIASMFRSVRRLTITAIIAIGSVFALSQLIPGNWVELFGVLTLLIITTIVIIVRSNLQWQAESELRRRNEQLTESEARFRAAIDAGLSIFLLLRTEHTSRGLSQDIIIVDANLRATELFQIAYDELIGKSILHLLPESYRQHFVPLFQQVREGGIPILNEIVMIQNVWLEYQIIPVGGGIALSAEDISERKKIERTQMELTLEHERLAMLHNFINDVSHDLRTPLSIINTNAYLAGKTQHDDQQVVRLQEIQNQVSHLDSMIDDMLNHSQLNLLTNEDLERNLVDLNDLLQDLIKTFKPMAQQKNQQLVFQASDQPARLSIDKTRLKVAISNIIDNALRYTQDSGTVVVSCQASHTGVTIVITDDGPGISLESLPHIVESFYRAEAHRPQNAGAGLGLSITNKIVKLHGGTIEAQNRPTGGMSFRVFLPF